MSYDEGVARRLREVFGDDPAVVEKAMFGGLAFLVGGHMAVAASSQGGLLLRVDPAQTPTLTAVPGVARFAMGGRAMDGWLHVPLDVVASDEALREWVSHGVTYARALPPK